MAEVPGDIGWQFDNTYTRLPNELFVRVKPAPVREPRVVVLNHALAAELGLDLRHLPAEEAARLFAGQALPPGAEPIAQAYAGHQFGGFTMLGDGRAILLGEHRTPSGRLVDIQFKGSGPTAFSRGGDGLAALGPMLREYIISEAMHSLGIPTTRSLAVVGTGGTVRRETKLPGAILTRVAESHIRVGTFQYTMARGDHGTLRSLADYTIVRHFPELIGHPERYLAFLNEVIRRQAALIARWQLVGFVHGVMNTDNMAVSGETIDYGPCAFMDAYHADTVFSSIDHGGRYAYGNQPTIAQWNLARFAETLLPLLHADANRAVAIATEAIHEFPGLYEEFWTAGMRQKLGLCTAEAEDRELADVLLKAMQEAKADFTNTFRDLSTERLPAADFFGTSAFRAWNDRWQARRDREGQPRAVSVARMRSANPEVIPRNHLVEEALAAASDDGDFSVMHALLVVVTSPYQRLSGTSKYTEPPPAAARRYRTFCGT
ncbi:MAG: YdiU family protein [Planctomycetia bacterium]|nr:YdiU family protein [Planctomycetia bacterium]